MKYCPNHNCRDFKLSRDDCDIYCSGCSLRLTDVEKNTPKKVCVKDAVIYELAIIREKIMDKEQHWASLVKEGIDYATQEYGEIIDNRVRELHEMSDDQYERETDSDALME